MLKSKVKKKLPALKFLGQVKRRNLTELFQPVKTLNFEDDEEVSKDHSCKNEWIGKYGERFRKIYIENKKIAGRFTFDYKDTLYEVKNEMYSENKITPFIAETIDDLQQVIEDSTRKQVDNVCPVRVQDPIEISDYIENETEEEPEDSTTWILLRATCEGGNSENSSKEFIDVRYGNENKLVRPEVEWKILNESMIKCQTWLDALDIQD